jgi:5-methylcytosine-specific restriction endonuclease McrA
MVLEHEVQGDSVMNVNEQFEKIFKEHIKIETYSKSIESLFSHRMKSRIDYKPYYQRNYIWNFDKATYFIESILLGTEIPPIIFFDNNKNIEIIDGRQRFETILRFMEGQISLSPNGLKTLTNFKKYKYDDLAKHNRKIIEDFLDSKLRIIEFKLVNEPPLDKVLEDRIKKEIFSRYNTGITPLKTAEVENAIYDEDNLTNYIKDELVDNKTYYNQISDMFFSSSKKSLSIESMLSLIRRQLILPQFPIIYFSRGNNRSNILEKLYEKFSDDSKDIEENIITCFFKKIAFLHEVYIFAQNNGLKVNRLSLECFLWGLGVMDLEEVSIQYTPGLAEEIANFIDENNTQYQEFDSNFYNEINKRYQCTSKFFEVKFDVNLDLYVKTSESKNDELKEIRKYKESAYEETSLVSLRIQKPEPSSISIDDISRMMLKRRFLVRPSYQRKEVINLNKASSIIESVLLGIKIPPIFIYKRTDGISEVIDGQQRLLTLLGFIGAEYIDENSNSSFSKNNKFHLRKPRILKEYDKMSFADLPLEEKNKIYDFQIYVVEIAESQNPDFDPIDLFIRLNDKPFPISEHSFEMWNSWADNEVIDAIKSIHNKYSRWYYVREVSASRDGDRMENEEVLTSITYLFVNNKNSDTSEGLDIYQKKDRINARISSKNSISNLLQQVAETSDKKTLIMGKISETESFIKKLKLILLDKNVHESELATYLKNELDTILKAGKKNRYFRRTKQDIYILWYLIGYLNIEMVKYNRIEMKREIAYMFNYIKNIPEGDWNDSTGLAKFKKMVDEFRVKYKKDNRTIRYKNCDILQQIQSQNNISTESGAPIFLGDEVEVDHIKPLAIGGKDEESNLQIIHKDENRKKGHKY